MEALSLLQDALTALNPPVTFIAGMCGIAHYLRQNPQCVQTTIRTIRRRVVRVVRGRQCAGAASR